ncbi:hypothetical protein QMK19_10720 [Streptomyces sp. H10-C2]|uniref:hypothetical protein n=1 Tax=unclassified Streptomyces TaxID=2593676 RepID=UPI0024BAA095|nr:MULTISPECIES: hypothetical protein [unclassified Streptomyces]MDJ0340482.1 hypothetical protein [Streptomyces sp. PH10-H1]MDJ0370130.1 hypothetical protein [Streptomyces sp. H10-C2]
MRTLTPPLRHRARASRASTFRAAALLAALVTAVTCGCGIRTTSVPVDAGPAPTRVSCAAPVATDPPGTPGTTVMKVYLVCSALAAEVARTVTTGFAGVHPAPVDRLAGARELLGQLQRRPSAAETDSGFASEVPGSLDVTGPAPGDPKDALRLSQALDELPSFALAQIVCTFAASPVVSADGRSVLLGGPGRITGDPVKRYTCTSSLRTRPDATDTAGTAVR